MEPEAIHFTRKAANEWLDWSDHQVAVCRWDSGSALPSIRLGGAAGEGGGAGWRHLYIQRRMRRFLTNTCFSMLLLVHYGCWPRRLCPCCCVTINQRWSKRGVVITYCAVALLCSLRFRALIFCLSSTFYASVPRLHASLIERFYFSVYIHS